MEFRNNLYNRQFLIILSILLSSFIAGCGAVDNSESKSWQPEPVSLTPPYPEKKDSFEEISAIRIATEKIAYVKELYNLGRFQEAMQEIETWTITTKPWRNKLINSAGDMTIYLSLAIGFNRRDIYDKLLLMDNNQTNSTTATICSVASKAWPEYSKWLQCIYASERERNECLYFETALRAKAPEAVKLIE